MKKRKKYIKSNEHNIGLKVKSYNKIRDKNKQGDLHNKRHQPQS